MVHHHQLPPATVSTGRLGCAGNTWAFVLHGGERPERTASGHRTSQGGRREDLVATDGCARGLDVDGLELVNQLRTCHAAGKNTCSAFGVRRAGNDRLWHSRCICHRRTATLMSSIENATWKRRSSAGTSTRKGQRQRYTGPEERSRRRARAWREERKKTTPKGRQEKTAPSRRPSARFANRRSHDNCHVVTDKDWHGAVKAPQARKHRLPKSRRGHNKKPDVFRFFFRISSSRCAFQRFPQLLSEAP